MYATLFQISQTIHNKHKMKDLITKVI